MVIIQQFLWLKSIHAQRFQEKEITLKINMKPLKQVLISDPKCMP